MLPELDVRQSAVAEDAGLVVAARRAHFSGTATPVELGPGWRAPKPRRAWRSNRPASAGARGPLPEGYDWWSAPAGSPGILQLTATVLGQEAARDQPHYGVLSTPEVRNGTWKLALDLPADLPKPVRTEHLRGVSVTDGGITATLEGAVRSTSTSETLITVRVTSAGPVSHVGQPTMVVGGKVLYGGLRLHAKREPC